MSAQLKVVLNSKLYSKNPNDSPLGKAIIKESINLIYTLGWESFTFKKLAVKIKTTEASIYRYFENKHKLLLYLVSMYWSWLDYQVVYLTHNLKSSEEKLKQVIRLIVFEQKDLMEIDDFDLIKLHELIIEEGSKVYLNKHVEEDNKIKLYKPYKDLCARIAGIMKEVNPHYKFPNSLTSTLIETAHHQYFFNKHLPSLTNFKVGKGKQTVNDFLYKLVFSSLK